VLDALRREYRRIGASFPLATNASAVP
jgi:hypothetical protein